MKRKIVWLAVSCLMVAALVLASCAPAVTEEEGKKVVVKEEEVPKYGGTFIHVLATPHSTFDIKSKWFGSDVHTLHMTNEGLTTGNWAKGAAGTNEVDWWSGLPIMANHTGNMVESWEVPDSETIIWHVRKGIHFGLNPESEASRLVDGRELTAQDVVFNIQRSFAPDGYFGKSRAGWLDSITATDKYTVLIKCNESKQKTAMMYQYSNNWTVYPPEVIEKYGDMLDWRNSVGAGPFFLVDVVEGSSYTFVRNPNYWGKDPCGLGKGNQLPYLDGIKMLLIKDRSTQIAALRTAKVDWLGSPKMALTLEDVEPILKTNPELKFRKGVGGRTWVIYTRTDKPELPFYDMKVRRALMMGIDMAAIKDDYFSGDAVFVSFPISPIAKASHTSLEELPEADQELWSYNPEKAKQLLAEAGYPDGFQTTIVCDARAVDMLSIVKDNWADIGVDLELDLKEYGVLTAIRKGRTHEEMIALDTAQSGGSTRMIYTVPTNMYNLSMVDDPHINEMERRFWAFENIGKPDVYASYGLADPGDVTGHRDGHRL